MSAIKLNPWERNPQNFKMNLILQMKKNLMLNESKNSFASNMKKLGNKMNRKMPNIRESNMSWKSSERERWIWQKVKKFKRKNVKNYQTNCNSIYKIGRTLNSLQKDWVKILSRSKVKDNCFKVNTCKTKILYRITTRSWKNLRVNYKIWKM